MPEGVCALPATFKGHTAAVVAHLTIAVSFGVICLESTPLPIDSYTSGPTSSFPGLLLASAAISASVISSSVNGSGNQLETQMQTTTFKRQPDFDNNGGGGSTAAYLAPCRPHVGGLTEH